MLTQLSPEGDEALRLVPALGGLVRVADDQLSVGGEGRVHGPAQQDAALQRGAPLVAEGDHVAVQHVRQAVELGHLQGLGPQLDDTALGVGDVHQEGEQLYGGVGLREPKDGEEGGRERCSAWYTCWGNKNTTKNVDSVSAENVPLKNAP